MKTHKQNISCIANVLLFFLIIAITASGLFSFPDTSFAQTPSGTSTDIAKESPEAVQQKPGTSLPEIPADDFDRGAPRNSLISFFKAGGDSDYERAAEYLDFRYLPKEMKGIPGPELARQLKIVLDRTLWIDLAIVSRHPKGHLDDRLPTYRDTLGKIETPDKTVEVLLQRVPRKDGVFIWKFSNRTVAEIPHLYKHFGYRPLEETLSRVFPDVQFLGWQVWQWFFFLVLMVMAFIVAFVPTWAAGILIRRKGTERSHRISLFVTGPIRILTWMFLVRAGVSFIRPSSDIRALFHAGTLMTIAIAWCLMKLVDMFSDLAGERLEREGRESAIVLLKPARTGIKAVIVIVALVVWLDNIGFKVGALLTGLGIGGVAIALAIQDPIKNLLGSIMILFDKPYQVGQRILIKGYDGFVEEIGLRSTKMRLLTGHQVTIPNDEMARVDIENIGRRLHIRRRDNIALPYDTPLKKVDRAVEIIRDILDNHEGMASDLPPRVYFDKFNRDSINILMIYWYQPADYWAFVDFNQRVNKQIMEEFEWEGISFALPTSATYVAGDDNRPLKVTSIQQTVIREKNEVEESKGRKE